MTEQSFNRKWTISKWPGANSKHSIDLPFDAMIHETRIPSLRAGDTSGYYPGGSYLYEKEFVTEPSWKDKEVFLRFEGVYQKALVSLNGTEIANHINGFTEFTIQLNSLSPSGEVNMLQVYVDNTQTPNCRWYTGSGIYRNVTLLIGNPEHFLPDGIYVETISASKELAELDLTFNISQKAVSSSNCITYRILFDNELIQEGSLSCKDAVVKTNVSIEHPRLWAPDYPNLYSLETSLITYDCEQASSDPVQDCSMLRFGIRSLSWSPETGLVSNGETIKLRGACIHPDNGPLGSAEFRSAAFRKISSLKECGYNAVRNSHCPASREIIDACDSLGMYLMDEFSDVWKASKNKYDYALYFDSEWKKDLSSMIRKDRGHASIVLYSIGNEVYDSSYMEGAKTSSMLADYIRSMDTTRPITCAINVLSAASSPKKKHVPSPKGNITDIVDPTIPGKGSAFIGSKLMNLIAIKLPSLQEKVSEEKLKHSLGSFVASLDVIGLNYGTHLSGKMRDRLIVHSETYPKKIGNTWQSTKATVNVIGDFMWTGFDYLGETGIGTPYYGKGSFPIVKPYPCCTSGTGSVDITGHIGAQGKYSSVVFGHTALPVIAVRPLDHNKQKCSMGSWRGTNAIESWSWSGSEGFPAEVEIYCHAPLVRLLLNDNLIGTSKTFEDVARFRLPWSAGILSAESLDNFGRIIGESSIKSSGQERCLLIVPSTPRMSSDIRFYDLFIVDENGTVCVSEHPEIHVSVSGPAHLEVLSNGSPYETPAYYDGTIVPYYGHAEAIIRLSTDEKGIVTTGQKSIFTISVSAEGYKTISSTDTLV